MVKVFNQPGVKRAQAWSMAAAFGLAGAWGWGPAAQAQHDVPILRPHAQEQQHTDNLPQQKGTWERLDVIIDPRRPELGSTSVIPELVAREFGDYMDGEAWEKAEETARILVTIAADRPASHYNLACALARRGKNQEAIASLEKSIDLGWRHYEHLVHLDPDLDSLRSDARFPSLVLKLEAAIKADRIAPAPLRMDDWELIAADIEKQAPDLLSQFHVPGASIALIQNGTMVWNGAFGVADERTDQPLASGTLFRLPAASRLLAAVLALQLEEQGIWNLDDPISKWLPDIAFAGQPDVAGVTIRRALNFTAGFIQRIPENLPLSIDEEIALTLSIRRDRTGSMYTYTPEAFLAVGRAIERAFEGPGSASAEVSPEVEQFAGSYGQLIQARILRPLRMTSTLMLRPTSQRFDLAVGHTEYGTPYRSDLATPRKPVDPIFSTAGDVAALVAALLNSGEIDKDGLLGPSSIEAMATPGLPLAPMDTSTDSGQSRGFGLGVMVIDTPHGRCLEIIDLEDGCGSLIRWYPAEQRGIVILFNSDTGVDAAKRIAHLALGGI